MPHDATGAVPTNVSTNSIRNPVRMAMTGDRCSRGADGRPLADRLPRLATLVNAEGCVSG